MARYKTTEVDPLPFYSNEEHRRAKALVDRVTELVGPQGEINAFVKNHFANPDLKQSLLQDYGYTQLRVGSGRQFIPISSCKSERVGIVFEKTYSSCVNRLNQLDEMLAQDIKEWYG